MVAESQAIAEKFDALVPIRIINSVGNHERAVRVVDELLDRGVPGSPMRVLRLWTRAKFLSKRLNRMPCRFRFFLVSTHFASRPIDVVCAKDFFP